VKSRRKLLLTGDHGTREYDETNGMRRFVLARGVREKDVFCDHAGFSTHDSLARAAGLRHPARDRRDAGLPLAARALHRGGARDRGAGGALRPPRVGGEPIPIEGDGRESWDVR
jgi:hypothetical protein